jgi:hypothetical protein
VTRTEAIAQNIARRIVRNKTRYGFSTLHRLAIEETNHMSNSTSSTTSSMNVSDSPAARAAIGREIPDNPASLAAASPARLTPDAGNASGMNGSQNSAVPTVTIRRVDCTVIQGSGSTSSDDVSKSVSTDQFKNASGPRQQMQGQQDSRNYVENGKAFKSTPTGLDSDAGN